MGILSFNPEKDNEEITQDLQIGSAVTAVIHQRLTESIKTYWDCFALEGCKRTIIGKKLALMRSRKKLSVVEN